jgi:CheY-like chemotaxis protein
VTFEPICHYLLSPHIHQFAVLSEQMNGAFQQSIQMARRLKDAPATRHIPIIFCTAKDTEDDMVLGLNRGGCRQYPRLREAGYRQGLEALPDGQRGNQAPQEEILSSSTNIQSSPSDGIR